MSEEKSLIISSEKLSTLFATAVGWKQIDGKWYDPKGKPQLHVAQYATNDILSWGALESLGASVGYVILKRPGGIPYYYVTVGTKPEDKFRAGHRQLARAICTAVCLHKGVLSESPNGATEET